MILARAVVVGNIKNVMANKSKIDKILGVISEKLERVDYAFIGSVNLYIQGLKVEPRDIDILTTPEDIKQIDRIFSEFRTKEIYFDKSEGRNSWRSFYNIDGIEIEVLGNVNNIYRKKESLVGKIQLEFGRLKLSCIPLVDELNAYKSMGRIEKVEMIQAFLQAKK